MALPNIVFQSPAGVDTPTQIHLPDGSMIKPAANGTFTASSKWLQVLLAAGLQIVTTGARWFLAPARLVASMSLRRGDHAAGLAGARARPPSFEMSCG
jgi:hypothetical protein